MIKKEYGKFIAAALLATMLSGSPLAGITAYADDMEQIPVKVLIVPKFEIGDIEGDFPGEAQLFYEHYCTGCEEIAVPNTSPTSRFYFNTENGVGLLLTGSGKMAAGIGIMPLFLLPSEQNKCSCKESNVDDYEDDCLDRTDFTGKESIQQTEG